MQEAELRCVALGGRITTYPEMHFNVVADFSINGTSHLGMHRSLRRLVIEFSFRGGCTLLEVLPELE